MRQGIITDIDWSFIGATLANESDDAQAEMLNAMAKEMLSWGTRYQAEMQVANLCALLTEETKELLDLNYKGN